jgi:hypothetical protein
MEVIRLAGRQRPVRPRDEEGGVPVAVDLACLTPEQRKLWDENFSNLDQWTTGTVCHATLLELWSFGYMCMLDCGVPNWPPELASELGDYGRGLREYMQNLRTARAKAASRFTFLLDRDGTLLRWDDSYVADVWWPPPDGEPGMWSRFAIDPFTASVTGITPTRARELAGADADLYAEASTEASEAAKAGRTGSSS